MGQLSDDNRNVVQKMEAFGFVREQGSNGRLIFNHYVLLKST
jgi:hypothetical protein